MMTDREFSDYHGIDRETAVTLMWHMGAVVMKARATKPARMCYYPGEWPGWVPTEEDLRTLRGGNSYKSADDEEVKGEI